MNNPFEILEVSQDANDEIIRQAYLKKVQQYPPEHAPEQFQRIRAAFEAIQTPLQRLKYQLFYQEPLSLESLLQKVSPERPSVESFIRALDVRFKCYHNDSH